MRLLTSFSGDQIKGCSYIFRMKEMVTRGLSGITFSEPSLWWPSPVKPPPKSISQPLIYKFVPSYFLSRFTRLFHNPSILYPSLSAHHQLQKLRIQSSKSPLPLSSSSSILLSFVKNLHRWFQESSKFSLKKIILPLQNWNPLDSQIFLGYTWSEDTPPSSPPLFLARDCQANFVRGVGGDSIYLEGQAGQVYNTLQHGTAICNPL